MKKYLTASDFAGSGLIPYMSSISTAIPLFWSITLFVLWIVINAASYYAILKTTGKKRFWHTFTAVTFIIFLLSLPISVMNGINDITYLSGYWVAFYLLFTVIGWYLLDNYK